MPALALLPSTIASLWAGHRLWTLEHLIPRAVTGVAVGAPASRGAARPLGARCSARSRGSCWLTAALSAALLLTPWLLGSGRGGPAGGFGLLALATLLGEPAGSARPRALGVAGVLAARGRGAAGARRRSPARRWSPGRRWPCSCCSRRCWRCSRGRRARWRRRCGSREPAPVLVVGLGRVGAARSRCARPRPLAGARRARAWARSSRPTCRRDGDRGAGRGAPAAAADRQPGQRPGRACRAPPTGARSSARRRAARACSATSPPRSARATAAAVEADAERYRDWYGVDGIFLDEVAHDEAELPYYAALSRAIRHGAPCWCSTPAWCPARGYFDLADVVVTFEGPFADYAPRLARAARVAARRPASATAHLVYAASRDAGALAVRRPGAQRLALRDVGRAAEPVGDSAALSARGTEKEHAMPMTRTDR